MADSIDVMAGFLVCAFERPRINPRARSDFLGDTLLTISSGRILFKDCKKTNELLVFFYPSVLSYMASSSSVYQE